MDTMNGWSAKIDKCKWLSWMLYMDIILWKDKLKFLGSNKVNLILDSTKKSIDYLLLTDISYIESNAN